MNKFFFLCYWSFQAFFPINAMQPSNASNVENIATQENLISESELLEVKSSEGDPIIEITYEQEFKVHILGDIPILGWFFKNKTKTTKSQNT